MILNKICKIKSFNNFNRKVWIDLPPSAAAPVYKEKVYVKALRMPKHIELNFKNDEIFMKTKAKKAKKVEFLEDDIDAKPTNNNLKNFNSSNSSENERKFNSGNLNNNSNANTGNNNNDFGFGFPNGKLNY